MCKLPKCFVEEFENIPEEVDRLIYFRDDKRKKVGVIIINNNACGWSLCKDSDQWDTFSGILVAWERLLEGKTLTECLSDVKAFNMKFNPATFTSGLKTALLFFYLRNKLMIGESK